LNLNSDESQLVGILYTSPLGFKDDANITANGNNDKKINGANNRELFELENEDIEDLKSTMNSLESKLNNWSLISLKMLSISLKTC